jgi:RNA polymerase sigma-70 factor (ECF subfamily)
MILWSSQAAAFPHQLCGGLERRQAASRGVAMDEQQFRVLYARTARPLRAYLIRLTNDVALADDLTQESYFKFLRSSFSSGDETHQKNYLFRIATNLARDHFRRRAVATAARAEPATSATPGHEQEVQLRSDVAKVFSQLAERDRQLLWLAYVEGSSHREIARILGLKAASIRSMLSRSRHRFVAVLEACGLAPTAGKEARK